MVDFDCIKKYFATLEHQQFEILDLSLEMSLDKIQDKMLLKNQGNVVFVLNFDTKASVQRDIIEGAIRTNQVGFSFPFFSFHFIFALLKGGNL